MSLMGINTLPGELFRPYHSITQIKYIRLTVSPVY